MKKVTGAIAAILYTSTALGATLMPNGQQQFIDATGKPYANGRVYFYSNFPACTDLCNSNTAPIDPNKCNTYTDPTGTVRNKNPIILDAAGRATIFGVGAYCQKLVDAIGTTIWTKYTADTSSASNLGWGGTGGGTANAQTVTVSGFANLNGQAFYYIPSVTNTTATTIVVNGGVSIAIVKDTYGGPVALTGGEIVAGTVVGMTYVSATGQFHLISNNTSAYVGEIRTFAYAGCPAGWFAADGSTKSATTYPALAAALGITWGTSAGNVVLPDLQNQFLRGDGSQTVGFAELNQNKSHTHVATVTDPGHTHSYTQPNGTPLAFSSGFTAGTGLSTSAGTTGSTVITGLSVSNASQGGTEARPDNKRVRFCVKY